MEFFSCMLNTVLSSCYGWRLCYSALTVIYRLLLFFCHVTYFKMKRSLKNCDLTEGHGGTKAGKYLEFDCEDRSAAGNVESASGWRRKSSHGLLFFALLALEAP